MFIFEPVSPVYIDTESKRTGFCEVDTIVLYYVMTKCLVQSTSISCTFVRVTGFLTRC